jgi:hypothetical protein
MGRKKRRKGEKIPHICAYCGRLVTDWSDDHVVPQCLFIGTPDTLIIKVPACARCNHELKSLDDSFLRDMVAIDEAASSHPDISVLREAFYRSAKKDASLVYRIITQYGSIEQDPETGMFFPRSTSVPFRKERVRRIFEWTLRGLYYHEFKQVLPAQYVIGCNRVTKARAEHVETVASSVGLRPKWVNGLGQFTYLPFWGFRGDPYTTFWQMTLYQGIFYHVSSIPEGTEPTHAVKQMESDVGNNLAKGAAYRQS